MAKDKPAKKLTAYLVYTDLPESLVQAALVKCARKYGREVNILPDVRGMVLSPKVRREMKKAVRHVKP